MWLNSHFLLLCTVEFWFRFNKRFRTSVLSHGGELSLLCVWMCVPTWECERCAMWKVVQGKERMWRSLSKCWNSWNLLQPVGGSWAHSQKSLGCILLLLIACSVSLGEVPLSGPQFSHMSDEHIRLNKAFATVFCSPSLFQSFSDLQPHM